MTGPSRNQDYHLILADIAIAAAVKSSCNIDILASDQDYVVGSMRDRWQTHTADGALLRRVNALANAGIGALQKQPAAALLAAAQRYGVPLDASTAEAIAEHFSNKRDAVLMYDR
jgi:hypothetical protein